MSVQSVERAIHLLEVVAESPGGLAAVADRSGLPLTTVSRLLATLEERAAVRRDTDGIYSIGSLVRHLGGQALPAPSIQDVALPELIRLAQDLNEAACVSVPVGGETLTLAQYDITRPVQVQNWEGHRWPITGGGSGAVMMATWPEDRVLSLLESLTPTERRSVKRLITEANRTGVSWSEDTYVEGLSSVAAPVLGADGAAIAAVLSYGPSYRFPHKRARRKIESAVTSAAQAVTEGLGGRS